MPLPQLKLSSHQIALVASSISTHLSLGHSHLIISTPLSVLKVFCSRLPCSNPSRTSQIFQDKFHDSLACHARSFMSLPPYPSPASCFSPPSPTSFFHLQNNALLFTHILCTIIVISLRSYSLSMLFSTPGLNETTLFLGVHPMYLSPSGYLLNSADRASTVGSLLWTYGLCAPLRFICLSFWLNYRLWGWG